jgi:hypothetical protein
MMTGRIITLQASAYVADVSTSSTPPTPPVYAGRFQRDEEQAAEAVGHSLLE